LASPFSGGKTLEIRRDEAADANSMAGVGKRARTTAMMAIELFQPLVKDKDRAVSGLLNLFPFPEPVDPPAPVSQERAQEILTDPRVKAQQDRDRALVAEKGMKKEEGGGGRVEEGVPPVSVGAGAAK
jgi:hypothetical protein